MAKVKFGEIHLEASVNVPKPADLPSLSHNPQPEAPSIVDIAKEVAKHMKAPEVKEVNLAPLKAQLDAMDAKLNEVDKKAIPKPILVPEVKQIIHHKDHTDDIHSLGRALWKTDQHIKKELKKQKTINLALAAIAVIAILSNLL